MVKAYDAQELACVHIVDGAIILVASNTMLELFGKQDGCVINDNGCLSYVALKSIEAGIAMAAIANDNAKMRLRAFSNEAEETEKPQCAVGVGCGMGK